MFDTYLDELFGGKIIVTSSTEGPGPQTKCQTHQLDVVIMAIPRVVTKVFVFVTMSQLGEGLTPVTGHIAGCERAVSRVCFAHG